MEDFLKHTKHCLLCLERFQEVHVVLGNEACDLDSMVSSLVYAFSFFKTLSSFPGNSVAVIPVFNMPQQDFGLRTEAVFLFGRCHIDPGLFTFNDDIELQTLLDTKRLKLVLVDHNVLSQAQRHMDIAVVEILDHHKDMWPSNLKVKKTIELVGSCSTLVAEKLLPLEILDSQMANLLLGTILLDTINLDPRAGRSTHKDQEIVKQLQDRYPVDLDELYTALSQAKFDVAGLSTRDLLRKDYKALPKHNNETPAVGISALSGLSMGMFFSRDRVQDDILIYCQTAALLDVLVIMFVHFPDGYKEPPQRQIAVCGPCEDLKTNIAQYLHASVELQLIEYCERHQDCFLYDQGNITATRKVVFPLVNDFLQSQL